jgi:hypothetical protein
MPAVIVVVGAIILGAVLGTLLAKVQIRAVLSGLLVHGGVWLSYVAVRIMPEVAGFFAKTLLQAFQATGPTMAAVFSALLAEITGEEIPPAELQRLKGSQSILDTGTVLANRLVPQLTGALFPEGPLTPEQAGRQAERLLGVSLAFSLDNWSDHTVLELTTLGQLSWAADVSDAIVQGLGLARVTRRAMQSIYSRSIGEPLEAHLNTVYRPARLRATELIDAWQQQLIDDGEALAGLAEEGYSYERSILLMNARQRDLGPTDVQYLLEIGEVDPEFVRRWARRQGYSEPRAELAALRLIQYRGRQLREELADTARRNYRAGVVDAGELRTVLQSVGYRSEEVDLVLVREDLELRNEKQLSQAQALSAYREGVLDERELRDRLRLLRFSDDTIDILLATQTKQLAPAQIIDALIRGIIPEGVARERLERQGYRPEDVDVLLDLRVRTLSVGQVIDAVTRGLLELSAARRLLEQQGFSAEITDLLLAFERRKLSVADVTAALVRGLITEGEARDRLLDLGYSPPDAALLLQLRFQRISAGEVLDAYAAGLVTRSEARQRLEQLGFGRGDAELMLQAFEIRQVPRARLSVGQLLEALRFQVLDEGTVRARLGVLGYSRADQDTLITLVAVRQPAPEAEGT